MVFKKQSIISTTLAGFFAWLPIGILGFLLFKIFKVLEPISEKLGDPLMPGGDVPGWVFAVFTALFIFLFFYVSGRLLGASSNLKLSQWLEGHFLNRIPGYFYAKGMITGFIDPNRQGAVRTGLIERLPGIKEFVYVIEELPDDQYVVFLPSAPSGTTGYVLVVRTEILEFTDVRLNDLRDIISYMGSGARKLLYPDESRH